MPSYNAINSPPLDVVQAFFNAQVSDLKTSKSWKKKQVFRNLKKYIFHTKMFLSWILAASG